MDCTFFSIFSTGSILVVIIDVTSFLVSCYSTSYIHIFIKHEKIKIS
jgi:hypothetical protein